MAGAGYKLFATGDVLSASDVNTYMMQQTVMVFANASARTSALSAVLSEGMVSYLQDTNSLEVYDGTAWVGATGDITGLTAGTGVSITSATGPVPTVAIDTAVVPQLSAANTFTGQNIINAAGTSTVDLIVRATASQTAALQQWQDSTGAVLGLVNSIGRVSINSSADPGGSALNVNQPSGGTGITVNGSGTAGSAINVLPAAGSVGLIVKGAVSQTADLQQWQNSGGTSVIYISSSGRLGLSIISSIANTGAYLDTGLVSNSLALVQRVTTAVGFIVRGASGQSADMLQIQSNAGTVLAKVQSDGRIFGNNSITSGSTSSVLGQITSIAGSAATIGLVVRGAVSMTASLQQWQNSAGTVIGGVAANGAGFFGTSGAFNASLSVAPTASTVSGIIVRGAVSQAVNLQEWQDSGGSVLASVSLGGGIRGANSGTLNTRVLISEANSGGQIRMTKQTAATTNPGADIGALYFRDGTTAGTLKLVVRAGASGAETTILDNIPQ